MPQKEAVRSIRFDRQKYGAPLSIDVADVDDLRGFIQTSEPHALTFYELMFVTGGHGTLDLDGSTAEVRPRALFVTTPGQVRRWRLRAPLHAVTLFFERDFIDGFFADASLLDELDAGAAQGSAVTMDERPFDRSMSILAELVGEMGALRNDSPHMLRAGLYQLLALLGRSARRGEPYGRETSSLPRALRRLVDVHFREHQRVIDYARLLGVTPEHLSRVVRLEIGTSASEMIHGRVLLEAKRLLRYSDMPIGEIAEALSFADASYFVRSFRRAVGVTPGVFRTSHFTS